MCGILGYVGKGRPFRDLLGGLTRLEYRGYDSCGIAAIKNDKLFLKKRSGKVNQLKKDLSKSLKTVSSLCILHTRWATHGKPNRANAHPHINRESNLSLVHNGIIENFLSLKKELLAKGYKFSSETDSEVIVNLIDSLYTSSLEEAVLKAIAKLKGSFALGVISSSEPNKLIAVRKSSPLIIGLGKNENFIASDVPAILSFTKRIIYLKDGQMAMLNKGSVRICDIKTKRKVAYKIDTVKIKLEDAQKKGYTHFMLKEMFEQPAISTKILSSYSKNQKVHFSGLKGCETFLKQSKKVYISACGTAYHAGYVAKYFLEKHSSLNLEIDTSSEFRYRQIEMGKNSLLIAISQSGETADTLAAVRQAKKQGAKILSVCNVVGSSLVKESDFAIPTLAGPEIGVASTKAYSAQLLCLFLFFLYFAKLKGAIKNKEYQGLLKSLKKLPSLQRKILAGGKDIRRIAKAFSKFGSFLFLGRGINYPSALEGALKLKEISYIPAEGYAAGEMKHGPIALIDEYRAVVCIAVNDNLHEKMLSNIQEAKARKGKILAIISKGDKQASNLAYKSIVIPKVDNTDLNPFLAAICLQLFAYYVAKNLGCEIDQPRNLAKSVTVE
tara:strand:- start:1689 stop:3521 length:1833 start_codon:yes stop_codon:yes gene_type:complete